MKPWNSDGFSKKAKKEDYLARSVYKLSEINKKEKCLHKANLIIDLGASPGSWSQYCLKTNPKAQLIAIDLKPINLENPRLTKIEKPIEDIDFETLLKNREVDLVLSDMAPKTTGMKDVDVANSFELASMALEVAKSYLRDGGHFIVKLFMGESFKEFDDLAKKNFKKVTRLRPESTRKHSKEIFFICQK